MLLTTYHSLAQHSLVTSSSCQLCLQKKKLPNNSLPLNPIRGDLILPHGPELSSHSPLCCCPSMALTTLSVNLLPKMSAHLRWIEPKMQSLDEWMFQSRWLSLWCKYVCGSFWKTQILSGSGRRHASYNNLLQRSCQVSEPPHEIWETVPLVVWKKKGPQSVQRY